MTDIPSMMDIPRTIGQIPQRQHNEDRLRRADSWLRRSKAAKDDTERFIFLWIAFNAAYGWEILPSHSNTRPVEHSDTRPVEYEKFNLFLREILKRDDDGVLEEKLCHTYSALIHNLLKNRYIFFPFWEAVRGSTDGRDWKARFAELNRSVLHPTGKRDVGDVLVNLFMRLYTLRNQIIHGGATFATGWGQDQVRDGSRIMESLVPSILKIMRADIRRNPDSRVWGAVAFPRVNDDPR